MWTRVVGASLRRTNTPGGWGGTQQRSIRGRGLVQGGYDPRSLPLPLYIPLLPDMAPLSHTEFRTLPTFLIAVNILS